MIRRLSVRLTREQLAYVERSLTNDDVPVARAAAEYAVACALRQKWEGAFVDVSAWRPWKRFKRDVRLVEVCIGSYTTAPLILYESDPDEPFILVLDRDAPEYVLAGWMFGGEAKKETYWNEADRCYVVPQTDLRSCAELLQQHEERPRGGRRDPAPDFGGTGRWPQMRYADPGDHPNRHGNIIRSKFSLPCCRCQTIIRAGEPTSGDLVTGTIHGDPAMCRMKKRR